MTFRRTHEVTYIDWGLVFDAYESLHDKEEARIDGAVPQQWFDEHGGEIGRRLGACWVYDNEHLLGRPMFRDEVLRHIGVELGYEEVK